MEDLQAEMKLLNWHKLANEAALKAALIRTKNLRKSKGGGAGAGILANRPASMAEKVGWLQQVIEEEHTKPLQVTKDWVAQYEAKEKVKEGKLEAEVARHIGTLTKLKQTVTERESNRQRKQAWRDVRHKLRDEKDFLLTGNYSKELVGTKSTEESAQDLQELQRLTKRDKILGQQSKVQGTLATVIGSLEKLLDLEKRISNLEKDNLYEYQQGKEEQQQQALQFTKRRTDASLQEPSRVSYSVKSVRRPKGKVSATKRQASKKSYLENTFLTGLPEAYNSREDSDPPEDSVAARMAAHLQQRRGRQSQNVVSNTQRRRRSDASPIQTNTQRRAIMQSSSLERGQREPRGHRTTRQQEPKKPSHMQQFHELRKQFELRKETMRKELYGGSQAAPSRRGVSVGRAPVIKTQQNRRTNTMGISDAALPSIKSKSAGSALAKPQRRTNPRGPKEAQTENFGIGGFGFQGNMQTKLPPVGGAGLKGVRARRDAKLRPKQAW